MPLTRAFISFDYDHDPDLYNAVRGQALLPDSPFAIADHSLKEASSDWMAHRGRPNTATDAPSLTGAGSISHKQAMSKAERDCAENCAQLDVAPAQTGAAYLESVKRTQREIGGK